MGQLVLDALLLVVPALKGTRWPQDGSDDDGLLPPPTKSGPRSSSPEHVCVIRSLRRGSLRLNLVERPPLRCFRSHAAGGERLHHRPGASRRGWLRRSGSLKRRRWFPTRLAERPGGRFLLLGANGAGDPREEHRSHDNHVTQVHGTECIRWQTRRSARGAWHQPAAPISPLRPLKRCFESVTENFGLQDLLTRPGRRQLPLSQQPCFVRRIGRHPKIMHSNKHAAATAGVFTHVRPDLARPTMIQWRRRLIQDERRGLTSLSPDPCKVSPLRLPCRKRRHRAITKIRQTELFDCQFDVLAGPCLRLSKPAEFHQPLYAERQVDHGTLRQQHNLSCAIWCRHEPHICALVVYGAPIRRDDARRRVQQRCLATCIRPHNHGDSTCGSLTLQRPEFE